MASKWFKKAAALGLAVVLAFMAAPMQVFADGTFFVTLPPSMTVTEPNTVSQQQPAMQIPVSALESQMNFGQGISFNDAYAYQVLGLINQQRAAAGLPALQWNADAAAVAKLRAVEISQYFSHTRPNGTDCLTAMDEWGVKNPWRGENIASGMATGPDVMNVWMSSTGHRSNILHEKFQSVGVACCYVPNSEYGIYWVQLFVGYPTNTR